MRCRYCDTLLFEVEMKLLDPMDGSQRGCGKCWDSIQDTLKDFNQKDQVDLSEPDELEVTSLEGLLEYESQRFTDQIQEE